MILLDTHVLIWMTSGSHRLGSKSRRMIDDALAAGELAVSSVSFWEAAMLLERKRIEMRQPVEQWRQQLLDAGLLEVPLDGATAILGASLRNFHGDPADRFIVATTIQHAATLITADRRIHEWKGKAGRHQAER